MRSLALRLFSLLPHAQDLTRSARSIPICWDTEEIAYFVGFQVDLVDQPNAILDRMRDGSYVVNYSLVGNAYNTTILRNPSVIASSDADSNKTISMQSIELGNVMEALDEWAMPDDSNESEQMQDLTPPQQQQQQSTSQSTAQQQQQQRTSPPTQQQQQQGQRARNGGGSVAGSVSSSGTTSQATLKPTPGAAMGGAGGEPSNKTDDELLNIVMQRGSGALELEPDKRAFNKLLLGHADDFIHVLSLKGSLLYCSPAVARVLEYEASELVGATLSSLCHPSDVVPVMRQLKDASSASNPHVRLLYRIRRKHSGYVWIESIGKLHIEPGKGRKAVIAVARPRDVLQMNWNELRQSGGLGDTEFWLKLNPRGTVLAATFGTQLLLGRLPQDLVGSSILEYIIPENHGSVEVALQQAQLGAPATVQYKVRGRRGLVDVVTSACPPLLHVPPPHLRTRLTPCPATCRVLPALRRAERSHRAARRERPAPRVHYRPDQRARFGAAQGQEHLWLVGARVGLERSLARHFGRRLERLERQQSRGQFDGRHGIPEHVQDPDAPELGQRQRL